MSGFSDRPFAAGSLIGVRSFKIDTLGRLNAINQPGIWRPGENVGECHQKQARAKQYIVEPIRKEAMQSTYDASWVIGSIAMPTYETTWTILTKVLTPVVDPEAEAAHQVASVDCTCGYYAYFSGEGNPYHRSNAGEEQVEGIVEGYGVCTVGSKGFRCSKAKIIALVMPHLFPATEPKTWKRMNRKERQAHKTECPTSYRNYHYGDGTEKSHDSLVRDCSLNPRRVTPASNASSLYPKVRELYVGVPQYPTLAAAVTAHPLTSPFSVPGNDPSDPEFWTKAAS